MVAELSRPGVSVIQEFRTVTPTAITPTLVPSIVGVCKQIVDVLVTTAAGGSTLNPSARVALPAFFEAEAAVGDPAVYAGLDGLKLKLSITNGPDIETEFDGSSLTPLDVVTQINAAFEANEVTEAVAEVTLDGMSFRVRTYGTGEFSSLEVRPSTSPAVAAAFGITVGYVYSGTAVYAQHDEKIPLLSFPDPRSNLAEIVIEPATVRAFLGLGTATGLMELSRSSSFLRAGGGGAPANILGTVSLSGLTFGSGGDLDDETLSVSIDGATPVAVNLGSGGSTVADIPALLEAINSALGGRYAVADADLLSISSKTLGEEGSVNLTGTACAILGMSTDTAIGTAGVSVVDDGNGDAVSPLVQCYGEDFTAAGDYATVTGNTDCTSGSLYGVGGDLDGKTLTLSVDGKRPQTITLDGGTSSATSGDLLTALSEYWDASILDVALAGTKLSLTSQTKGDDSRIDLVGGTALSLLGLVPSVTGAVDLSDLTDIDALNSKILKVSDGTNSVEYEFTGLSGTTLTDITSALNGDPGFSAYFKAEIASSKYLKIYLTASTDANTGIAILPASSNDASFLLGFDIEGGFTYCNHFAGPGFPPASGDTLYVDGTVIGRITAVAPGGVKNNLRLDKQMAVVSAKGSHFYIQANRITSGATNRPVPNLTVADDGAATIKPNVVRDSIGRTINVAAPVYLSYTALRRDVTAAAANPSLLQYGSTTELEANLSPINALNPLALGMYFALLNAPGVNVTGIGVDQIAPDAPLGTVEAFTRAAAALEQYEVYAIAPLTHDETVAQVMSSHVSLMSDPESKGERICLFNFTKPERRVDTLVASGLDGGSVGTGGLQFDTKISNLSTLVNEAGINPNGTIPVKTVGSTKGGLFLSIADSPNAYSISNISGSVVTIRTSFGAGENDDSFFSTDALNVSPLPATLLEEPYSVKVRGLPLVQSNGAPDKQAIAETYQSLAQGYANRRFWSIMPDSCAATVGGLEQQLDGFYMCAAYAGMIGKQPPQQSFTNFPVTGFTRVIGSNEYFTERQLNAIAAGGNFIVVQDAPGVPLTARMGLTSDMTSLETRTDSITKVVDFVAKFMRTALRTYIGRYNITQGFLDSLGHVCQGLLGYLVEIGVLIGANLNNVIQDEDAPDTVLLDVTLDVPYPCNYLRLTLAI